MPHWAIEEGLGVIRRWQNRFPYEATWARTQLGIPSLIVRLDMAPNGHRLNLYEIEERPAGIGISYRHNPQFKRLLEEVRKSWPKVSVIASPQRHSIDDHLWTRVLKLGRHGDELVLIRAEPDESEFHGLESYSVSSLKEKGNKSYGLNMKLWQLVAAGDELPWDEAFVLKPVQGSKCRDIEFWIPKGHPLYGTRGSSTRTAVGKTLSRCGQMYLQPFVEPVNLNGDGKMKMIYRVFFGFDLRRTQWKCLGGMWNARPNLRIHGASDSLFGSVTI
ncbi:MAG: hypothetical protein M1352_02060 [Patescibacteria group bacterium]|nr:hypothetical protein [Patescibacteria group bacterium]